MKAFIDSDILIWHLRGKRMALNLLKKLRDKEKMELWTGAMQRAEVAFFMRPVEKDATLLFLAQFKTASVNQAVVDKAAELYHRWNPSHGMDINDAILAATVIRTGGKIYTLNTNHYPLTEVVVQRGWKV